ncbi:MAG: hypothetical protein ACOZDD_09565 [Bacteroidota bacterium]
MIIGEKNIGKFFLILVFGFIVLVVFGIKLQKKIWNKYPTINFQSEIRGEVTKIRINRGIFIELMDGRKFSLPSSDNLRYEPYSISRFIVRGDTILKHASNDTINIIRNEEKYFFILGERVE